MFKSVKELIARDIKTVEESSSKQLLEDARKGSNIGVKALLAICSDLNVVDDGNNTPFLLASANGHLKIIETLINYKSNKYNPVDVHWKNRQGNTALHLAAMNDHLNVVNYLLMNSEVIQDVNAINKNGNSPLHLAAMNGHRRVVNALLRIPSINVSVRNKEYKTPAELAKISGHKLLAEDLKKFSGNNEACNVM